MGGAGVVSVAGAAGAAGASAASSEDGSGVSRRGNEEEASESFALMVAIDGADGGVGRDVVAFDAQARDVAEAGRGAFDGDFGGCELALEILVVRAGVVGIELHGPEEAHGIDGAVGARAGEGRVASGVDGAGGVGGEFGAGFPAAAGVVNEPGGEADAFVGQSAGEEEVDGLVDEGGIGSGGEVEGAVVVRDVRHVCAPMRKTERGINDTTRNAENARSGER